MGVSRQVDPLERNVTMSFIMTKEFATAIHEMVKAHTSRVKAVKFLIAETEAPHFKLILTVAHQVVKSLETGSFEVWSDGRIEVRLDA